MESLFDLRTLCCFDQVDALVRDVRVEATWRPPAEAFARHFPLWRMVPGSLVLEAFAQLGSLLLETSGGFAWKALPAWIERARFRRPIEGTEPVFLAVCRVQGDPTGAVLEAEARQADEVRATARFGYVLAPISRFYAPEHLREYRAWVDGRLTPAARAGLQPGAVP
jgi:3-hydroxymyristoyl/3-hydroxydecanoyl-(acyl carrier protein) dehydratase